MSLTQKSHEEIVKDLYARGAHTGYRRTRRHPSVVSALYGTRNRVDVINLEETVKQMERARTFLQELHAKGKNILLVGTKAEAKRAVHVKASALNIPFVVERWIGGTITNTREIGKRVATLKKLSSQKEEGTLVYKTKKERLMLDRMIAKLGRMFSGVVSLEGLPNTLVVVDPRKEHIAVREANMKRIPVVALANTDCDISNVQYPIVCNDASIHTIQYILDYLTEGLTGGSATLPHEEA